MKKNKRFIIRIVIVLLFAAHILGVGIPQQTVSVFAKTTGKYYVKEKYMRDLDKTFKVFKKKYGWTFTNGEFSRLAWCSYQVPGTKIHYTFQGDHTWKMKNNSKCIAIRMKAKTLVSGFRGKIKINTFVSRLDSKKKKASWRMGGQLGRTAMITFYGKNGQKYWLNIEMNSAKDRWISQNDYVVLTKA